MMRGQQIPPDVVLVTPVFFRIACSDCLANVYIKGADTAGIGAARPYIP